MLAGPELERRLTLWLMALRCRFCGGLLTDSPTEGKPAALEAQLAMQAQFEDVRCSGWTRIGNTPVYGLAWLEGLHVLVNLFRAHALRDDATANTNVRGWLTKFNSLRLVDRVPCLEWLASVLLDWPWSLLNWCRANHVKGRDFYDTGCRVPYWLHAVVDTHMLARWYRLSNEEYEPAVGVLMHHGEPVNPYRIAALLGIPGVPGRLRLH
jgi:hypothetical protein